MSKKCVDANGRIDWNLDPNEDHAEGSAIVLADVLRLLAYAEDATP